MLKIGDLVTIKQHKAKAVYKIVKIDNLNIAIITPIAGSGEEKKGLHFLEPAMLECAYGCKDQKDFIIICQACSSLEAYEYNHRFDA